MVTKYYKVACDQTLWQSKFLPITGAGISRNDLFEHLEVYIQNLSGVRVVRCTRSDWYLLPQGWQIIKIKTRPANCSTVNVDEMITCKYKILKSSWQFFLCKEYIYIHSQENGCFFYSYTGSWANFKVDNCWHLRLNSDQCIIFFRASRQW